MATHLDLEEQEQLDQLKSLWKQYGNLVTWVLIGLLAAYAAWNGWQWWQRDQAVKAGAMYDELDKAAQAGDADRAGRVFDDMKDRYPRTAFTEQGGLLAARLQFEKGRPEVALQTLAWVGANAVETEYRTVARLRAAGVLLDQKKHDEALKQLDEAQQLEAADGAFGALVADRRGDVLASQGKRDDARAAYQKAWAAMDPKLDYRRLVEAKLTVLGAAPAASAPAASATRRGVEVIRAVRASIAPLATAAALGLAGCSSLPSLSAITNLFGADKPKAQPLEPIATPIAGRAVWNARVESVRFPLVVAVNDGVFTVAGSDGTVLAVQAETGREVWRAQVGARLSAGVGSDGRFAAVVTRTGELVVLEAGQVKWRKALGARVTTPPLVAGERVFVLGVDRAVQAFDAVDGRKLWALQRPGDPLTLAQSGVLTPFKDTLLAGQGPRLTGIDPLRGTVRWEVAIGSPRGANEVERLADLVGPVGRVGEIVCARSFQAAVGCVNAERGTVAWTKNVGGSDAVSADAQYVFGADASDRLTAWKLANGEIAWTSEKLLYRSLSAPLAVDQAVVFGDADGIVHWLARDTGEARLRLPTDGSPVAAAPVAAGATMLVVTRNGGLFAFRPQ